MAIRVPLLGLGETKSIAVIHRLDPTATRSFDPPGEPTSGYDPEFDEPVVYDSGTSRLSARHELPLVRVPCQVETPTFEHLQQFGPGIVENTALVIVTHRQDLQLLSLIDPATRACLIKKSDRVSAIERYGFPGVVQQPLAEDGLYVFEIRPGSWGFGPEGHDLEIIFLEDRAKAVSSKA